MTIQRILDSRPEATAEYIAPDATITKALDVLATRNIGALIVSGNGVAVEGIISERDIVRCLQREGPSVLDKTVGELMTTEVVTCSPDDRAATIMAVMVARHFRHVPVVREGKLVDVVGMRDLLQLRLDEVQSEADAMRSYIVGNAYGVASSAEPVDPVQS